MKQSWFASWFETIASTATGFVLSLGLQYVVCWWYGLPLRIQDNLAIIALFTVASLLRGIAWRRLMEKFHIRTPLSPAMLAVIAERRRQIDVEGWSASHDDFEHSRGALAHAGGQYAINADWKSSDRHPVGWRWAHEWWKPTDFRRNLVKAAALILAEIEKFDRTKTKRSAS